MTTARAPVIVSGGDSVTPFTTPTVACSRGVAAGNTATALREHLLRPLDGRAIFPRRDPHTPRIRLAAVADAIASTAR